MTVVISLMTDTKTLHLEITGAFRHFLAQAVQVAAQLIKGIIEAVVTVFGLPALLGFLSELKQHLAIAAACRRLFSERCYMDHAGVLRLGEPDGNHP